MLTLSPQRLMEESETCMERTLARGTPRHREIITRVYDNPRDYSRWESRHFQLMRHVADGDDAAAQLYRMRRTYCSLITQAALFELVRDNEIRGQARQDLFRYFHRHMDFNQALLSEHGRYLRASSSLLCTDHLESQLMHDRKFMAATADYRKLYAEYFEMFCNAVIAEGRGEDYMLKPLIRELKDELVRRQAFILALPLERRRSDRQSEQATRAAVGFLYH